MRSSYGTFQVDFAILGSITLSSCLKLRSRRILTRFIHDLWSRRLSTSRESGHSLKPKLTRSSATSRNVHDTGITSPPGLTTRLSHRKRPDSKDAWRPNRLNNRVECNHWSLLLRSEFMRGAAALIFR